MEIQGYVSSPAVISSQIQTVESRVKGSELRNGIAHVEDVSALEFVSLELLNSLQCIAATISTVTSQDIKV